MPHLFHLLGVVLLEDCFPELGRAEFLVMTTGRGFFDWGDVAVAAQGVIDRLWVVVVLSWLSPTLNDDLDFAFQFHVCFDFCVDGEVAQGEYFFFVFTELVPAVEELLWFLDVELVLDEAVHPEDVVVLSLQLQLVADQEA